MQSRSRKIAAPRQRSGYTLFEVMLVLAILVAVGAVAAPVFRQSFEVERLRKGADTLRTAWSKARVQAMSTGLTHIFQFEYAAGQFVVAPWEEGAALVQTTTTNAVQRTGQLPDGIVFYAAEKLAEERAATVEETGAQQAPQIFFYPDGTTSTAQVMLSNQTDRFVKVFLRGLTGVPNIGEVVTADELAE
jgi:prepilin-type N-terminal cleavage/methylation domain-containing protein